MIVQIDLRLTVEDALCLLESGRRIGARDRKKLAELIKRLSHIGVLP